MSYHLLWLLALPKKSTLWKPNLWTVRSQTNQRFVVAMPVSVVLKVTLISRSHNFFNSLPNEAYHISLERLWKCTSKHISYASFGGEMQKLSQFEISANWGVTISASCSALGDSIAWLQLVSGAWTTIERVMVVVYFDGNSREFEPHEGLKFSLMLIIMGKEYCWWRFREVKRI